MDRLRSLQEEIRAAGHGPPSKGLLLSALIFHAPADGKQLEARYLAPYRRAHPEEDKPR
jgi:hypothetical protein